MVESYKTLLDLEYVLLKNNTDTPFITSDNPVVLYNQLFEERNFNMGTFLTATGLQIFFPVTPKYYLFFYDKAVYWFTKIKNGLVNLDTKANIDVLNKLQCTNAYKTLYFNEFITTEYIEEIYTQVKKYRREKKIMITRTQPEQISDDNCPIRMSYEREGFNINLKLSFLEIKKKLNMLSFRRKTSPVVE